MSLWTVRLTAGGLLTAGFLVTELSPVRAPVGASPERFWIGMARPFKALAGGISGVELIWANGELDGFVSQIVDKIASNR
jgi:hypothetical protein